MGILNEHVQIQVNMCVNVHVNAQAMGVGPNGPRLKNGYLK